MRQQQAATPAELLGVADPFVYIRTLKQRPYETLLDLAFADFDTSNAAAKAEATALDLVFADVDTSNAAAKAEASSSTVFSSTTSPAIADEDYNHPDNIFVCGVCFDEDQLRYAIVLPCHFSHRLCLYCALKIVKRFGKCHKCRTEISPEFADEFWELYKETKGRGRPRRSK